MNIYDFDERDDSFSTPSGRPAVEGDTLSVVDVEFDTYPAEPDYSRTVDGLQVVKFNGTFYIRYRSSHKVWKVTSSLLQVQKWAGDADEAYQSV